MLNDLFESVSIPATSVYVSGTQILAMSRVADASRITLSRLELSSNSIIETASFDGSDSFLLAASMQNTFAGIDDNLLFCDQKGEWRTVLQAKNRSNFFWHLVTSKDGVMYVQEYGEPPTGIYASKDGNDWELLITAQEIDRKALHFHDIAYDPYRDMLIATLGDRNYVKTAVSTDGGNTWTAAYKGAWQLLPIVVTEKYIVFGMDSGLANGGLVKWYPECEHYDVIHLDWKKSRSGLMQMADLERLSNKVWMAALGKPQAIIASTNLSDWHPFLVQGFDNAFNYHMSLSEGNSIVAFSTGRQIIWINKEDLGKLIEGDEPTIHRRYALLDRLAGIGYVIKRKIEALG